MGTRGPKPGSKKASESAKRRVQTIRARYGDDFYSEQGKRVASERKRVDPDCYHKLFKRVATERKNADPESFVKMGEKGGAIGGPTTLAKYGHDHYVEIGKKSAQKRKEMREENR